MRAIGLAAALMTLVMAACGEPTAQSPSAPGHTASPSASPKVEATPAPSAVSSCRLPVYWEVNRPSPPGIDLHAGIVSVPDGAVSEVGVLPELTNAFGATYDSASNKWLRVDRQLLSPDGTRYVYWAADPAHDEVHVVDIGSRSDRMIYNGPTLFIPLTFGADGIYLVHAINPRQGAFEKLYRLDPAGGTPTLVTGSDRHMYQWGWVLISDGAAWGVDYNAVGNSYIYSVLRLDLATAQVSQWFEGPPDDLVWPLGTDTKHRQYVQGVNQHELWRFVGPGQAEQLANPGPIGYGDFVGGPTDFVADSRGGWFHALGSVWFYSDAGEPRQFSVGPPDSDVYPAGPCV